MLHQRFEFDESRIVDDDQTSTVVISKKGSGKVQFSGTPPLSGLQSRMFINRASSKLMQVD